MAQETSSSVVPALFAVPFVVCCPRANAGRTVSGRPSNVLPCMFSIAKAAAAVVSNVTNAKPLALSVIRSFLMLTPMIVPNPLNRSVNSTLVILKGRLPTNILEAQPCFCLGKGIPVSVSVRLRNSIFWWSGIGWETSGSGWGGAGWQSR